jgi:diguanylate cyclase (GGDEF)-like protein
MISIRKYLDATDSVALAETAGAQTSTKPGDLLSACVEAYCGAISSMGRASMDACPAAAVSLDKTLAAIVESLAVPSPAVIAAADANVRTEVENWGRSTARHYQQKAAEVKEILLAMVQAAESVTERDERCARHFNSVTANLKGIASLEDISQIRTSIEKSASDLKGSIDRMTAEGKTMQRRLQTQLATFEAKLAEAEQVASCDALTRLHNRLWMESQIERRMAEGKTFCVALLDLDGFKDVNDQLGHIAGDDVLRQFASELKSACRSTDLLGRWGGDEFLVLLDGTITHANAQMERVSKWVCGSYKLNRDTGRMVLRVRASIGLAEFKAPETMNQLLDRADAAMYLNKPASRRREARSRS